MDIETATKAPVNGLIKVSADSVTSGTVMKISANSLTSGIGMHIISKGSRLNTQGKLLSLEGNYQKDGILLDVSANQLELGTAIRVVGGSAMREGKLMEIVTKSEVAAADGVFSINVDTVQSGKVFSILANSLTSGTALEISTKNGNQLDSSGKLLSIREQSNQNFIRSKWKFSN